MLGKNWITTVGGLITALGATLIANDDPTLKLIGQLCSIIGPLILGWAAKQYNVTGGSVPQASPPGVTLKSDALGVIEAVDALKKQGAITISESIAKTNAEAIVTAAPVSPADVKLTQ